MKTAKDIAGYIESEVKTHSNYGAKYENGYYTKLETLTYLSSYILKFEYMTERDYHTQGIEDALRWILEEDNEK